MKGIDWFNVVVLGIIFQFWRETILDSVKSILPPVKPENLIVMPVLEGTANPCNTN
jgi:hypothetical protein